LLEVSARIYDLDSAEEFAPQQLLERLLAPEEPAALVAWLCTADSSALTGAALPADGGLTTS
jgi:NAD(P)-dependent dehydrogenase (short-subunit alcohol dehydrogenase family)